MPRRRSHGLTVRSCGGRGAARHSRASSRSPAASPPATTTAASVTRQLVLPGTTPLALLTDVHIDRAGDGLVLLGNDGASVRWIGVDGAAPRHRADLPAAARHDCVPTPRSPVRTRPATASSSACSCSAANGTDAELHLVAAPTDGSDAAAARDRHRHLRGVVTHSPPVDRDGNRRPAACSRAPPGSTGTAACRHTRSSTGKASWSASRQSSTASAASRLRLPRLRPGKEELTINYQRASMDARLGPNWLIADVDGRGRRRHLKLNVALPRGNDELRPLGPVRPDAGGGSPGYAMVWQDASGSWLSVYYGPQTAHGEELPVRLGDRLRRRRACSRRWLGWPLLATISASCSRARIRSSCGASTRRATAARARCCSRLARATSAIVASVVRDRSADIHLRRPDRGGDGPEAGRRRGLLLTQAY